MNRTSLVKLVLGVGVLVMMLALAGCGSGSAQEEAVARPLPEQPKELRPGEYRSERFDPPVSFRVGKDWETTRLEANYLELGWAQLGGLAFLNVEEVYKPIRKPTPTSMPELVEAPEDLVGWFQDHPYLKVSEPKPISVGGVEGQQFDVVSEVPEDHLSICGSSCVDAIKYTGSQVTYREGDKVHAIVLEDVKGETVYIDYGSVAPDFGELAPEGRKLVETVKWTGS